MDPFAYNRASSLSTFLSPSPVITRSVPAMRRLVSQILNEECFDVAIASTEVTAAYVLQAPSSTVRVLEEHNSLTRWMYERYKNGANFRNKLRCWGSWQKARLYESRLFKRFDLITMVSELDQSVCQRELPWYKGRVEVVANGVDCEFNKPAMESRYSNVLVYNGALTYHANFEAIRWFLADVYPRIRLAIPQVRLIITGSTDGVNLNDLLIDASVSLPGFIDDVRKPVGEAAVCVAPIREGGGTRLKILEAMALGTPVVSTSKGAEGLNVKSGYHLLIANDPSAFAQDTITLLRDSHLRAYLAANARKLVEDQYDWCEIGTRFVKLVESTTSMAHQRRTVITTAIC